MTTIIISSQRHLDDGIVAEKLAAQDYVVALSPKFDYDGQTFAVVLDGHHSLAAAKQAGVEPDFEEYTASQHDAIGWLDRGDPQTFLDVVHMGSDYYNVATDRDVW